MVHSFNYAIIQAVPDSRRGERVNIGLVVFKGDGLDVRIAATRKLSSLTARSWDAEIKAFGEIIAKLDDSKLESTERRFRLTAVQEKLTLSETGWFEAKNTAAYDATVRDILRKFVFCDRSAAIRAKARLWFPKSVRFCATQTFSLTRPSH